MSEQNELPERWVVECGTCGAVNHLSAHHQKGEAFWHRFDPVPRLVRVSTPVDAQCALCGHDYVASRPEIYDCKAKVFDDDPTPCCCDDDFHAFPATPSPSVGDPEERKCVACGKPAWAHACDRPPLSHVCAGIGECIEAVEDVLDAWNGDYEHYALSGAPTGSAAKEQVNDFASQILAALEALKGKAPELRGGYRAGMLHAAKICKDEFNRSPYAAKDRSSSYMSGYEDACDHLSVAIEQAAVIDCVSVSSPVDVEAMESITNKLMYLLNASYGELRPAVETYKEYTPEPNHICFDSCGPDMKHFKFWATTGEWGAAERVSGWFQKQIAEVITALESLTTVPAPESEAKK